MKIYLDKDHSYDLARMQRAYQAINRRVRLINKTIPPMRDDGRHDDSTAVKDRAAIAAVELYFEKARGDIQRLHKAGKFLVEAFENLRAGDWIFVDDGSPDADLVGRPGQKSKVMPESVKCDIADWLDQLYYESGELFQQCGYFLELCCIAPEWKLSSAPRRLEFTFPHQHLNRTKRTTELRRTAKTDIQSAVSDQLETLSQIISAGSKYAVKV